MNVATPSTPQFAAPATTIIPSKGSAPVTGGRFDFDDGGTFCGGWEDGKAQGHGVCTGPKGQGEFSGLWHGGFEMSGVYTWPSGSTFEGQWASGKRHGLGIETRGRWVYRGEWTTGLKGRYGVRQSITSGAKYDGTWANGLQDGYGSEIYADGGTFQGQWMKGMRHGYGVRSSAPFGLAAPSKPKEKLRGSLSSLNSENVEDAAERQRQKSSNPVGKGGFVLKGAPNPSSRARSPIDKSATALLKRQRAKRPRAAGTPKTPDGGEAGGAWTLNRSRGSLGSSESLSSGHTGESAYTNNGGSSSYASDMNPDEELIDNNVIESYMGEWKNDRRSGYGIAERSDGVKYEGEWHNNRKYGYGITTFKDGSQETGKYINNILVTSGDKRHLFFLRSTKFRRKIEAGVNGAARSSEIALQKADIAISRTATARGKAEQAETAALHAQEDSKTARMVAKQFAPDFNQPGIQQKFHKDYRHFNSIPNQESENSNTRSRYGAGDGSPVHTSKDYLTAELDQHPFFFAPEPSNPAPPASSAFLDVFLNNPDRRPSAAGFLRRPSVFGSVRRPSTFVEIKLAPQLIEKSTPQPYLSPTSYQSGGGYSSYQQPQQYQQQQYQQQPQYQQQQYQQQPQYQQQSQYQNRNYIDYSLQQVIEDHFSHYKPNPGLRKRTKPYSGAAITTKAGHPSLSKFYGPIAGNDDTPDSGISESMDNEEQTPTRPPRRSTLPTALDPDSVNLNFQLGTGEEDEEPDPLANYVSGNFIRTGSLSKHTTRPQSPATKGPVGRKKSLPDITQFADASPVLSREAVAALSSQRREAIRRQEEEAEKLSRNPLLYLYSPDLKDWLSQQQLMILVLFINISLAILFFKLLS